MFAGIVIRDNHVDLRHYAQTQTLTSALTPYNQADLIGAWADERAMMVGALTWNTQESKYESVPETCARTGRFIVSWARLDNRKTLCAMLGLTHSKTLTDPQIILASHQAWGAECANKFEGDFSFVIYDPASHTAYCARDSLGVRPFFFYLSKEVFIFASTAAVFPHIQNIDASISEEWLARFLVRCSGDRQKTAYNGVFKLMSAHHLTVQPSGTPAPKPYFQFRNHPPRYYNRDSKWVKAYSTAFDKAVSARMRSDYFIGSESSGGIDSSTILARAVKHLPHAREDMHCFGLSHMQHEAEFLLDTPMQCGIEQCHIVTTPPYVLPEEITKRSIRAMGYPEENGLAAQYYRFYEGCSQHGIRTLLSGFGGDEVVTSSAEELYNELLNERAYWTLFDVIPGNTAIRAARVAKRIITQRRRRPLKSRPNTIPKIEIELLKSEVVDAFGISARTSNYNPNPNTQTVNDRALSMLSDQFTGGMRSSRLEACSLMAITYGVSYRWPMYDRQLIQQYLNTPSIEKRHREYGRYLHRRACDGEIPSKILWKPSKSLGPIVQLDRQERSMQAWITAEVPDKIAGLINIDVLRDREKKLVEHRNGGQRMAFQDELACIHGLHAMTKAQTFLKLFDD